MTERLRDQFNPTAAGHSARHDRRITRRLGKGLAAAATLLLAACGAYDDPAGLKRADYEDLRGRRGIEQARPRDEPPIPDLQPILATPTRPDQVDDRRVTITVTENTALRDVLIELARKAEVDLELDPRIEGGVIFSAQDRPLREVVRRLCELAGLRYALQGNILRIELDEPYSETYRIDALNLKRTTTSQINASTDVFSAVGASGGGSGSAGNGSSATIKNESVNDFWDEVQKAVDKIIQEPTPNARLVKVGGAAFDPNAFLAAATQQAPDPAQGGQQGGQPGEQQGGTPGQAPGQGGAGSPSAGNPAGMINQAAGIAAAQQAAIAQATGGAGGQGTATPAGASGTATGGSATGSGATGTTGTGPGGQYAAINKQAGVLAVFATQAKQRKITDYIKRLQSAMSGQVLIEAKVVEVELSDDNRAGINWSFLGIPGLSITSDLTTGIVPSTRLLPTGSIAATSDNLSAILDFLSTFGTSRTLSSPRLTVTNNQTAMLKVAENQVYFTLTIDREIDDNGTETRTYTSTPHTVPIGLLMAVQPSINRETGQITLNLRPTISRIVNTVEDPAVALQLADINATNDTELSVTSAIPVVEVREMDSVVNMESGSVMVMGGLMQERAENSDEKIPGIGDIPLVGNAFKKRTANTSVIELVLFLRASIVRDRDTISPADTDLYDKYAPDPRPLAF